MTNPPSAPIRRLPPALVLMHQNDLTLANIYTYLTVISTNALYARTYMDKVGWKSISQYSPGYSHLVTNINNPDILAYRSFMPLAFRNQANGADVWLYGNFSYADGNVGPLDSDTWYTKYGYWIGPEGVSPISAAIQLLLRHDGVNNRNNIGLLKVPSTLLVATGASLMYVARIALNGTTFGSLSVTTASAYLWNLMPNAFAKDDAGNPLTVDFENAAGIHSNLPMLQSMDWWTNTHLYLLYTSSFMDITTFEKAQDLFEYLDSGGALIRGIGTPSKGSGRAKRKAKPKGKPYKRRDERESESSDK
jgi:hypothetical protein